MTSRRVAPLAVAILLTSCGTRSDAPAGQDTVEAPAALPATSASERAPVGPHVSARGNEPGWSLTIDADSLELVTDYGQSRLAVAAPAPRAIPGGTRYEAQNGDVIIEIMDQVCRDGMSGMPYPQQVSVVYSGTTLRGCGGESVDVLTGPAWVVEDIDGVGVVDRSHATLEFVADGRVSGDGSCNRYNAPFTLTGEAISFGEAAVTRKACPPALMTQEDRFLKALSAVTRFDLDEAGALRLIGGDRTLILARRGTGD